MTSLKEIIPSLWKAFERIDSELDYSVSSTGDRDDFDSSDSEEDDDRFYRNQRRIRTFDEASETSSEGVPRPTRGSKGADYEEMLKKLSSEVASGAPQEAARKASKEERKPFSTLQSKARQQRQMKKANTRKLGLGTETIGQSLGEFQLSSPPKFDSGTPNSASPAPTIPPLGVKKGSFFKEDEDRDLLEDNEQVPISPELGENMPPTTAEPSRNACDAGRNAVVVNNQVRIEVQNQPDTVEKLLTPPSKASDPLEGSVIQHEGGDGCTEGLGSQSHGKASSIQAIDHKAEDTNEMHSQRYDSSGTSTADYRENQTMQEILELKRTLARIQVNRARENWEMRQFMEKVVDNMKFQLDNSKKEAEALRAQLDKVEMQRNKEESFWKDQADKAAKELSDLKKELVNSAIAGLANDKIPSISLKDSASSTTFVEECLEIAGSIGADGLSSKGDESVQTKPSFNDKLCEKSRQMMKRSRQQILRKKRRSTGSIQSDTISPPAAKCMNDKLCEKSRQMMMRKQRRSLDRDSIGTRKKNVDTRIVI